MIGSLDEAGHCPKCGSDDIEVYEYDHADPQLIRALSACLSCEAEFTEEFLFNRHWLEDSE